MQKVTIVKKEDRDDPGEAQPVVDYSDAGEWAALMDPRGDVHRARG